MVRSSIGLFGIITEVRDPAPAGSGKRTREKPITPDIRVCKVVGVGSVFPLSDLARG
jgi:hypothetical protein